MTDILRIEDHTAEALARVIDQFNESQRYKDLIASFVDPMQEIEDSIYALLKQRSVETATGANLDELGAIVDQPREGRTDEEYRLWIGARILANRSTGIGDDSLNIMKLLEPTASGVHLIEHYPAAYSIVAYGITNDPTTLFNILKQVKPAGVSFWFEYSPLVEDVLFSFSDNSATELIDLFHGFGDSGFPDTGGHFTGVIPA